MEQHSELLTKILESVFNTHGNETPVHTISPLHEWPTMRPFDKRPTVRPFDVRPTFRFRPFHERPNMGLFHERPTLRPPLGPHWNSKPPDIKTEPPSNAVGAFSLEKLLWVVLSGFGVMVLMAIFMKLGGPIRRVRRQLSNVRPAPNDVITVTLRPDIDNLDMTSLLRLSDDLPPPYSECVRSSTGKRDIEEPPPRFSDCSVSFTNPQDAEPQVHIQRPNNLIENRMRLESVPMNKSESVVPGMKTELVFDEQDSREAELRSIY